MLGPVVDIELVDPPDKAPSGVVFGVKHFLTIPSCPEVREALEEEGSSHKHYIIKMTKRNGTHEMEVVDSTVSITSQYLVTDKLAERSLCKITSAWLPWGGSNPECTHRSLKDVVVTERVGRCPHTRNSLYIWCVCPGSEREFQKEMKNCSHERTDAFMKVDIEKSQQHIYNIKVRLSEREGAVWEPTRQISHVEMCKFNGVKLFDGGTLKGDFGCSCAADDKQHCMGDGLVFFEIEKVDQLPISHDALLLCRTETAVLGVDSVENKRKTLAESAHGSANFLVASKTSHKHGWGSKSGTEDDREALRDIISAELKKPENLTTSEFCLFF